jgi:hypothetical protein
MVIGRFMDGGAVGARVRAKNRETGNFRAGGQQ